MEEMLEGNMSCFLGDTSGSSSDDNTASKAWIGPNFVVHDFFQFDIEFPSFGCVKRIRPPRGNRVSSWLHPNISNAILKIIKMDDVEKIFV